LAGFSIAAGIQLSRKKKRGILLAQIWLGSIFVLSAASIFSKGSDLGIKGLIFSVIWLSYFWYSKRVKNTFGI